MQFKSIIKVLRPAVLSLALIVGAGTAFAAPAGDDEPLSEAAIQTLLEDAQENSTVSAKSEQWWALLSRQLTASLASPIDGVRHQTVQLTITLALRHPDKLDLRRAVPHLAYMYASESDDRYRMMALSALHTIGSDLSMQLLSEAAARQSSSRIRLLTNAALAAHHPEQ